ncbi:MAG: hypothetical protein VX304_09225 [Planctomycetota bacterium]|nr:hypothetical protein [Planctomycetota bacterium]
MSFRRMRQVLVILGLMLTVVSTARAQSEARSVVSAEPRYLQRGAVATVLLRCAWLPSAEDILFYSPGLDCQGLKLMKRSPDLPSDGHEYQATIRVSPDCRIGQHRFRIRDRGGLSTLHTLYVGPLPRLAERTRSTTFEDPQAVALNTTVAGYISKVGQVDWFRVVLKKGQRLNVDVQAVRMAQRLFDAHVTILDARARVLAESDDTGLGLHDPITGIVAKASGPCMIAIRESGYGNEGSYKGPRGRYLLHVGTFPRALAVIAEGRVSDKSVRMTFLGDPQGTFTRLLSVPNDPNRSVFGMTTVTPTMDGLSSPTPHPIRINNLPTVAETEPNDDWRKLPPSEQAAPIAFAGVISKPGDVDTFRFQAEKGDRFRLQVFARRLYSRLDSVVNVYRVHDGTHVAGNDDPQRRHRTSMFAYNSHHAGWFAQDAYTELTTKQKGVYAVAVADHLKKGGIDYHYRIEVTRIEPKLTLFVRRDPPYWRGTPGQSVSVPRGNRYAVIVENLRQDCPEGKLTVAAEGLPSGVSLKAPGLTAKRVPMLFTAAGDSDLTASLARFRSSDVQGRRLATQFEQSVFYGLNPPNYAFFGVDSERLAVAVAEEYPVHLDMEPLGSPLVQEGETQLTIRARVGQGLRRKVRLSMLYMPAGVSAELSNPLSDGEQVVRMRLEANRETQPGRWPIAIVSREATQLRGGGVSTQLRTLEVLPAFLDLVLTRSILRKGETVELKAQLEQKVEFTGTAKAELLGLPKGVTAKPVELDTTTEQIRFRVTAGPTAAVGLHKTLSCRIAIPWKDTGGRNTVVTQLLGRGGQLRILETARERPQQQPGERNP